MWTDAHGSKKLIKIYKTLDKNPFDLKIKKKVAKKNETEKTLKQNFEASMFFFYSSFKILLTFPYNNNRSMED